MPTILSVQSRVAYGHVGNAASVFPLQRLGIEAWALDTVAFSNHTGHGRWRGAVVAAAAIAAEAAAGLRTLGPSIVLVTSLDLDPDRIAMLAAGPDGVFVVETPRLPVMLNGCGDVAAALFLARLLQGESLADALALTAAA